MPRNLDLDLIRTFVTVADHDGMTSAARQLCRTHDAVSQQVKRLKEVLDSPLVTRTSRGLALSRQGEQLLPKTRRLLHLNDDIWAGMSTSAVRGVLRIGVPHGLLALIGPAMKTFANAHPGVDLTLTCAASAALREALVGGKIDVVLFESAASEADGDVLRSEPLVWVAGRGSDTWRKRPLPLSMVDERCEFRP